MAAYHEEDLDAFTIPPFSPFDGIEGLYADDDRTVSVWSRYHAARVNVRLPIARRRVEVFTWQVADVTPRGNAAMVAQAEANLAAARAELAIIEHRRDLLEQARATDPLAPTDWTWA